MKADKKRIYGKSLMEWQKLADRYFDAQTTDQEEDLLKKFLATPEAKDAVFDEIKAVMGFFVVGKKYAKETLVIKTEAKRNFGLHLYSNVVAAAVLACVVCVGSWYYVYQQQNICIAYINGIKCTDTEFIMEQMLSSMTLIEIDEVQEEMEIQLKELFSTLHEDIETINR
ncbi:MAG: hypothetical protein ACRC8J_05585 [Phocaeicola sp.]